MLKNDKLDALILLSGSVLIDENVRHFESTDTSCVLRPRSLDRRVKRNIKRESLKNDFGTFFKYAKRVAAVILVICTVSFAAIISVDAVRKAVWNIVVEFFDDYMSIFFESELTHPKTLEEIKDIDPQKPEWEKRVMMKSSLLYYVEYYDGDTLMLSYIQCTINENGIHLNNKNSYCENIQVGNHPAVLIYRADQQLYSLSWSDGIYAYELDSTSTDITREDIIAFAESTKATDTAQSGKIKEIKDIDPQRPDWEKKVLADSIGMHAVMYYENGEKVLGFTQGTLSGEIMIDNENSTVEEISIGNNKAVLVYRVDHKLYSLVWNDSAYSYSLNAYSPDISKEALISMAESLK